MSLMMRALVALNNFQYFQTAASTARSLFELLLDIKLLAADEKGDVVRKYHEFSELERYRAAELLVKFEDQNPGSIKQNLSMHRAYLSDGKRSARIGSAKITGRNGKVRYPTHWSTYGDARSRAISLNLESDYVEIYPLLSWYVHAGSTGVAGISAEALESCFAISHSHSQRIFLDATIVCARITKLDIATEGQFKEWIELLRLTPGIALTKAQMEAIEKGKAEKGK